MRWLDILRMRLRSLFQRDSVERELDEELRFHLGLQIQQNIAAGMQPAEARYAALRQFGHPTQRQEECRDARGTRMIENFFEDLRYALRGLRRDRFLVFSATATLAICIGANTTVFSMADSILIRPLPYPGADRIDWISERSGPVQEDVATAPDYYRLRDQNRIFDDVAAFMTSTANRTGVERPEQLDVALASVSFFRVMGTEPLMGRYLAREEEGLKAPHVAVLSYAIWRNRLGSDPHILGKAIALNRQPYTIVGVMPQGFDFPRGTQIWMPLEMDEALERPILATRPIRIVDIVARRKPGVTPQQAEAEMQRLTFAIRAEYPKAFATTGFRSDLKIAASPLQRHLTGQMRPALLVLSGAVGLVLLIACVNLANLLLARAGNRQRELAIRLALGSGRGRVIRQMLTESLVLALPGGLAGIAVAWIAVRALNAVEPSLLVNYPAIAMDMRVTAFTAALTLATAILFGMAPALSAAGISIQEVLKSAGRTHSTGRGTARLRKLLVVAELSVSLVLLIGAGLLARSFLALAHRETGFPTDHLLTFRPDPIALGDFAGNTRYYLRVLDELKQIPLARTAALLTVVPFRETFDRGGSVQVLGHTPLPFRQRPRADNTVVSREFFQTLELPLLSGRIFDARDSDQAAATVVVTEAFARELLPGEDPLGRRIVFGPDGTAPLTIIGVVGDIRDGALGAPTRPAMYRCTCQGLPFYGGWFVIRTAGDPRAAIRAVEARVRAVDRDQPIFDVKTMDERRDLALAPQRFQFLLIGIFAAIAILLAAAGVYGVMSYLVARRTREIGIRIAMGARPADVLEMVMGESALLVLAAIVCGLGGAWALTRYVRSMLFGVTELDAFTFTWAPVLLAIIVMIACLGPARRAVRVDPMMALREE
jgi:predicted permease